MAHYLPPRTHYNNNNNTLKADPDDNTLKVNPDDDNTLKANPALCKHITIKTNTQITYW